MEESVSFVSNGLKLTGVLHRPPDMSPGERRPACLILHGFGSNKGSKACISPAKLLETWGYIALRFDMRGCGESEGPRARVICMEQVEDTKAAVTYLLSRPDVDPSRIICAGHSFGAAVSVYAGGVDQRIGAVISSGGWGDGYSKFQLQHSSLGAWERFTAMIDRGRTVREKTGESIMIPRYDIVPIPNAMRGNLAPGSVLEFPLETVESMLAFRANDVVGAIAPRPLLLLHASTDSVTPTEQSIGLFQKAGMPTDLHLIADVDHFMFAEDNEMVTNIVRSWLKKHLNDQPNLNADSFRKRPEALHHPSVRSQGNEDRRR